MTDDTRRHELESLLDGPGGIRQIAEAFDRVRRKVGDECPAIVTIREMIDYVVEHEQPA